MLTFALTTSTYESRRVFQTTANAELLVKTLFHYRDQGRYSLHGFAVMPEHLHVLLSPSEGQTIERCAQFIKGGYSHAVREHYKGEVWLKGFHGHQVRDLVDYRNQLAYIAENPEKRHLVDYLYVHTKFLERLDAMPEWFRVCERQV